MRTAVPAAKSIGRLVNTHSNGDHTFGNQLVKDAEIITSRACAEEMKELPGRGAGRHGAQLAPARRGRRLPARGDGQHSSSGTMSPTPCRRAWFDDELKLKVGAKDDGAEDCRPGAHARRRTGPRAEGPHRLHRRHSCSSRAHPVLWAGPVDNWVAACDQIHRLDVETSGARPLARSPTRRACRR